MASKATRVPIHFNKSYKHHGMKSYVYLLRKYNIKPTKPGPYQMQGQKLMVTRADGTTGEVQATDQQNNSLYTCPVQIGTPAQTLTLDFDSGSSDLWCWSTELPKSTQSSGSSHHIFDPTKSSTWKTSSGSTWSISYGDSSSASGTVGTDNVTIGDITIKAQAVELANKLSTQFVQDSSSDGLLGLAFGSINTVKPTPVQTPVENMITQDDIPQSAELFTAYLGATPTATDSFYTFGAIDNAVIPSGGQIAYTTVDSSQGFWEFPSASVQINGKATQNASGNTAIADTGTTLLLLSDAAVEAVYAQIPGSSYSNNDQGYVFPASTQASALPQVTVMVGNTPINIDKSYLAFAPGSDTSTVYGAIQSRGSINLDIFGDVFLRSVYAVFDVGNTRFGCVQRAATSSGSGTSAGTGTGTGDSSQPGGGSSGEHHHHHKHHNH